MADSALSLTKTAVEGTVGRVLKAIDEDKKLKAAAQQDLRFIVGEFQIMRAFLEEAKAKDDNKERPSNKAMKAWVRQLRELAFDVEDCVEFVIHVDTTSARAWWSWVWRVLPLPSRITPAWATDLDQAVAQLKQLKASLEELSLRNTRYNLLGGGDDSGGSSTTTPLPVPPPKQLDAAAAFPSTISILRNLWEAKTKLRLSSQCSLQNLVADGQWSNKLRVISVWRSAGVDLEAAHILDEAYSDPQICQEFKVRARVKLMQTFNIQEVLKSLLNQLYMACRWQDTDLLRTNEDCVILQDKVRQLLSKDRYLIILEGLSSAVEWDLIRFCLPDHHNGSRIIISTEQLKFALSCTSEPYQVLQLALFPNDRYIYAFYKSSGFDMAQLIWQIGQRRVISLWRGEGGRTASIVRDLFDFLKQNFGKKFKGVFFEEVRWVNVPTPFSLEGFCQRLPHYHGYEYVDPKSYFGTWRYLARRHPSLVVIEGLQSKEDWNELKDAGLVSEGTQCCIVIITNEAAVAKDCDDDSLRNNDAIICPLLAQKTSGIGTTELIRQLGQRRVISLWGDVGRDKASIVRDVYEAILNGYRGPKGYCAEQLNFQSFFWVDVPSSFTLEGFCQCLPWYVSDGYRDPKSYFAGRWRKEVCKSCNLLIVIDGLRSKEDWDEIKDAGLVPEETKSCIVIIANEEEVAKHCEDNLWRKMEDDKEQEEAAIIGPQKSPGIDKTEFIRQLGVRRVISLWGDEGGDTTCLVEEVFEAINDDPEFKGLNFEESLWINIVPCTSLDVNSSDSLEAFYQYCLPDYVKGGSEDAKSYFDDWSEGLCETRYLIVIEGLPTEEHWDLIRDAFVPEDTKSCIVIITNKEAVARHCKDYLWRKIDAAIIDPLFAQKSSGIGITELVRQLGQRRVISLWGDEGRDRASLVRDVYEAMKNKIVKFKGVNFERFEWVHAPISPFSLEEFCGCLPWYTGHRYRDPESYFAGRWSKDAYESRHLIVIEGLQSQEDWDLIKDALVPEYTKSCIIIIANEEAVAKHCEDKSWRKSEDVATACPLPIEMDETSISQVEQGESYYSWGHDFSSHGCSRRMEEAFSQLAQFFTPDQDKLLSQIHEYCSLFGFNSVWGATGVGKSALVRFVYYFIMAYSLKLIEETKLPKRELLLGKDRYTRFDRFGWVDVPDGPFDLAEFSRCLLLDFNSHDPEAMEKTAVDIIQGHNPIQQCYEIIRRQKCLVVIDGLQSTRDWDSIKQAFWSHHYKDFCILVITTDKRIAQHCDGVIHITPLNDTSARRLFKKVVSAHKRDHEEEEQKLKHANRIVPMCDGRPKIIDAVAKSHLSFLQNINDDLVTKLKNDPQFGNVRGVLSWIHSYFDGCPDSVKPCVFYLSIFPRNYKVRKAHLLRRWIAEGYSRDTAGSTAKENAEWIFNELVTLEIIKEVPSMPLYQLSGFLRDYIISQPMEDNLVFALEANCKPNSQRTVRHLTIMERWEREEKKHVFESIDMSRLRSLTVYGEWQKFFVSEDKMKRIRVLDLEGTSGLKDDELKRILGILLSLKFISLRGCKSITCLPKALGDLRQLESLDVRDTSIVTLPQAIIKLQNIQYIRAGVFLPFEDWTLAEEDCDGDVVDTRSPLPQDNEQVDGATPDEDNSDDAVGSQQPTPEDEGSDGNVVDTRSPQDNEQVDGTTLDEDNSDDAVGSQQPKPEDEGSDDVVDTRSPLPQHNEQVDGTTPDEDNSDDAVGSQQPTREDEGSDGDVMDTRSPLPLLPQDNKQVDDAKQNKFMGCCWASSNDDAVESQQPSGTATRPGPGAGQMGQPLQAPKGPQGASRIPGPVLTETPQAEGSDGAHQGQHQHQKQRYLQKIKKVGRHWTSRLSSPLTPFAHTTISCGVEVPKGIQKMSALHTLGTVNISRGGGGTDFLNKLKLKTTLPQLRKLSVCGINTENWKDLCEALSAHDHLESLSLVLDEDCTQVSSFNNPPKAIRSLKLYGHIHKLPAWTWLNKLEKFDLEVIISSQDGMNELLNWLPSESIVRRLHIKPTPEVSKLEFKEMDLFFEKEISPQVLKINCSSHLEVVVSLGWTFLRFVRVLIIHCSKGSDFRFSWDKDSNDGLYEDDLDMVWLKGYDEKAEYVADLEKQVAAHPRKPVFKFEKLESV